MMALVGWYGIYVSTVGRYLCMYLGVYVLHSIPGSVSGCRRSLGPTLGFREVGTVGTVQYVRDVDMYGHVDMALGWTQSLSLTQ
jgi:hypothetical protein